MSLTPEIIQELIEKLDGKEGAHKKHIMLSYNWGVQPLVLKVHDCIERKGIRCWMDVKGGVSGDINAAMAVGVENALVICPFMTEKYQESESCQLELSYAKDSSVQIVPCLAQSTDSNGNPYKQRGWLGVITAGKLWTDFRDCDPENEEAVEERTTKLLMEIANKFNVDTRGGFKPAVKPAAAAQPAPPVKEHKPKAEIAPRSAATTVDDLVYGVKKITLIGFHKKYVHPTPNDGCRNKRAEPSTACNIEVEVIGNNRIALKSSSNGKYLSAQPNGTLEWNRGAAQAWEHFTVGRVDDSTISLKSCHGKYVSAQPGGDMHVNRDKCLGWEHFTVQPHSTVAAPPPYKPRTVDDLVYGVKKITLIGFHKKYVHPTPNGGCGNKRAEPSKACNIEVEVIGNNRVALNSSSNGKYLSAQPNGTLEWNRGAAQAWEHFTVGRVNDNTISLKSCHGKFVSAQPGGDVHVNRDKCLGWEHFTVLPQV